MAYEKTSNNIVQTLRDLARTLFLSAETTAEVGYFDYIRDKPPFNTAPSGYLWGYMLLI